MKENFLLNIIQNEMMIQIIQTIRINYREYCLILIIICTYIYIKWKSIFVKNNSKMFQNLLDYNKSIVFNDIKKNYLFKINAKNKQHYDKIILNFYDGFMQGFVGENKNFFKNLIANTKNNRYIMDTYLIQVEKILNNSNINYKQIVHKHFISVNSFRSIETKICNKNKLIIPVDFVVEMIIEYHSPKYRNYYRESFSFDFQEIETFMNQVIEIEKYKESHKYQRLILTDKLRYEILQRDNFKCVLCGLSAKDGIKLHVDHIIPISKGGKTIKSNLRTLCERCNLGKGSMYDESKLN